MSRESRTLELTRAALAGKQNSAGMFTGHAAVFKKKTWIGDQRYGFWEQVAPEAFDRALSEEQDVRFLVDHDPSKILARTLSGTLQLSKDRLGLAVRAELADTTVGRDLAVLLERGDVSSMSFGFTVEGETWEEQRDGSEIRTITDVNLFDVSAVTFPAYPQTDASLRAEVEAAGYDRIRTQRWQDLNQRFAALKAPRD